MDVDDEDDFYSGEERGEETTDKPTTDEASPKPIEKPTKEGDAEDGEEYEEEEDSDSDIEIVTESKDAPKHVYNKAPPSRNPPVEAEKPAKKDPFFKKSPTPAHKIDVDAKPIFEPAGKPITQVIIDEDLPENDKPWRKPGADISDYFNYGFDEFTWALYAAKQEAIKTDSQNSKKMFDDMTMMFNMGSMPAMTAMPGMPGAGGADVGMPPEMQAMMQQMMAGGIDPSQMDPSMFGGAQGGSGQGGGSQGFGAQGGGFNQGQNNYGGYDQGQQQQQQGHRGGFRGRGRGRGW
ncbi:Fip1 motif-domain-containing protein [Calycina marina]|uniref:Fip1 motif-domain-containing protein n=1 Tax=Calycina marina TaxID=1763456 RepID=A0A9P7Z866_9HELO|nr:Fip1 motif-domain-containing protein [Calycina marina]